MKPPSKWWLPITITLMFLTGLAIGFYLGQESIKKPACQMPSQEEGVTEEALPMMQENTLIGVSSPFCPKTLGMLMEDKTEELLQEIIKRESGGDPNVCSYAGCNSGMGLTQLIPSTVEYCEDNLGKEIDPFDADDNLECARWLLENDGIVHWEPYSGPY